MRLTSESALLLLAVRLTSECAPAAGGGGGGAASNPLLALAACLGIEHNVVELPAIAPLHVDARGVPLIYLLAVGGAACYFGWRVLAAAAVGYVIVNHIGAVGDDAEALSLLSGT